MENIVRYELKREEMPIGYTHNGARYEKGDIANHNVFGHSAYCPETVATFDSEDVALKELEKYQCTTWAQDCCHGEVLFAEEYWLEKATYNKTENGELALDKSFVWDVAPLE